MTFEIRSFNDRFIIVGSAGALQRDGGFGLGEPFTLRDRSHAEAKAAWMAQPTILMSKGKRRALRARIAAQFNIPADIASGVIS